MLKLAHSVIAELPAEQAGTCVLTRDGTLYTGTPSALETALARAELVFHRGSIRGAPPQLRA